MALLAFDTCFGAVSVAVRYRAARGEWLIREAYEARQTGHAERLMPMIAEVMAGAGLPFSAIERFAVTVGPGSFTGVRVGVSAARAFVLAAARPAIGISSLDVMAARGRHLLGAATSAWTLMVAVDARRGGHYCAVYRAGETSNAPSLLLTEEAAALAHDTGALVVGSGGPIISQHATAMGQKIDADLPSLEPHAHFLALMAVDMPTSRDVAPLYLRAPDVKPQPPPVARQS